jgi:hypothetical protein
LHNRYVLEPYGYIHPRPAAVNGLTCYFLGERGRRASVGSRVV